MQLVFIFILLAISNIEGKENILNLGQVPLLNETLNPVDISQSTEQEFDIDKDTPYSFTISNENYLYSFISQIDNIFCLQKDSQCINMPNGTFFRKGDEVIVNGDKN